MADSFVWDGGGNLLVSGGRVRCSGRTLLHGVLNTAAEDMLMAVKHETLYFSVLII